MEARLRSKKKLSLSLLLKIIKETIGGFVEDSVTQLSGSLAYATLFSIIPFLSLLVTIGVFFHADLANELYSQLEPIVGKEVITALQAIIASAEEAESSSFAAIVSLGISIFGATTIFAEMQSSLNTIWGIKAVPKKSWLKYLKNRLLSFSVILVFAFILLITFSVTNIIGELSNKFMSRYPEVAETVVRVGGIVLNLCVTVGIFTLIFKILPDARIRVKDVFVGAVVTTVLLLIGQWGISLYISMANIDSVYGAAAFMVIFITWIYYSSIIVYMGAEFTQAWANEMGSKIVPDEFAVATKVVEVQKI